MASLYQRKGRPGFYLDFTGPDGKRRTRKVGVTRAEGLRVKAEIERDVEGVVAEPGAPLTVGDAADAWLAARVDDPTKRNIASERMHVERYIVPALGALPLTAVTFHAVRSWARDLSAGRSPKYVHNLHGTLRAILGWVMNEHPGAIPGAVNPAAGGKAYLPRISAKAKREHRQRQTLDRHELVALFTAPAIEEDWRVLYRLAFYTAARSAEVVELRWRDYDPAREPLGEIVVERSYGSDTTKTDTPRPTPVHPDLADALARWRADGFARLMGRDPRPDDPIVPHPQGYARRPGWYYRRLRLDLEALGLRPRGTHAMRRAFQSIAIGGGAARPCVRAILHTSDTDISDTYLSIPWEDLCAAVLCVAIYPTDQGTEQEGESMESPATSGWSRRGSNPPPGFAYTQDGAKSRDSASGGTDGTGQGGLSVSLTPTNPPTEEDRERWRRLSIVADGILARYRARARGVVS